MAQIDDFKANLLGGGARANQYTVIISPPPGIATGLDVLKTTYLVRGAALPSTTLGEIAVPFRGRNIYLAGDRSAPDTWDTTFLNDTDFMIRTAIERWSNGINDFVDNTGVTSPSDYTSDLIVEQKDRDDTILKTYIFRNAFPTTFSAIDLSADEATAIEEFTVTWRYQHFEASGVNF